MPTLAWDVVEQPIYTGANIDSLKVIEGQKAIVRNDNGIILATAKDSYHVMNNEAFVKIAESLKQYSGFEIDGYQQFADGRKVLGYLKNNGESISIGGHKIEDYMLIGNSFDGSTSFFSGTVTELLRCSNQFGKISKHSKIRHTVNSGNKVEEYLDTIKQYFAERNNMYSNFNRFGEKIVSEELFNKALNYILEIDNTKEISTRKENQKIALTSAILNESKDLGNNVWGLFNGVTKYTTHELGQKENVFGNIFGTAEKINQRAYEFCAKSVDLVLA
jgi:hypothetical protein